jgi:hypothetical protein
MPDKIHILSHQDEIENIEDSEASDESSFVSEKKKINTIISKTQQYFDQDGPHVQQSVEINEFDVQNIGGSIHLF